MGGRLGWSLPGCGLPVRSLGEGICCNCGHRCCGAGRVGFGWRVAFIKWPARHVPLLGCDQLWAVVILVGCVCWYKAMCALAFAVMMERRLVAVGTATRRPPTTRGVCDMKVVVVDEPCDRQQQQQHRKGARGGDLSYPRTLSLVLRAPR